MKVIGKQMRRMVKEFICIRIILNMLVSGWIILSQEEVSSKKIVGVQYYPNGEKYDGEWDNNMYNGEGTFVYTDGSKYEGQWRDNKKEGPGIFNTNS
jgi:hypothetical protein